MIDYKKLYEDLVDRIKRMAKAQPLVTKEAIEMHFPEIVESEDEKIRKELIAEVKEQIDCIPAPDCRDKEDDKAIKRLGKWLTWLEKHKEENLNAHPELLNNGVKSKFKVGDWVVYDHRVYQVVELPKEGYINLCLKRNGKIEFAPSPYCEHWTIQDAKDGDVLVSNQITILFKKFEENSDCNFVIAYAGIDVSGKLQITDGHWLISNNSHPATKEQRDTLFAKMKEAGYEWDAEKKELKKIEQKPVDKYKEWYDFIRWFVKQRTADYTLIPSDDDIHKWGDNILNHAKKFFDKQKPAWSEEDELHIRELESLVKQAWAVAELKNDKDTIHKMSDLSFFLKTLKPQPKQEWSEEDEEIINKISIAIAAIYSCSTAAKVEKWLKSLKERYTWNPSEEQIETLDDFIYAKYPNTEKHGAAVKSLYQDLKKLKG